MNKPSRELVEKVLHKQEEAMSYFGSLCNPQEYSPLGHELLQLMMYSREAAAERMTELCIDYIMDNWEDKQKETE
jgi:hypothetical protein